MSSVSSHLSSASTLFDPAHPHEHHHGPKRSPTPPPSPPHLAVKRQQQPASAATETFFDTSDEVTRDAKLEPNERRARAAVRHALRNCRHMDDYSVTAIVGFGSNGVVLSAIDHSHHSHRRRAVAVKIIYKTFSNASSSHPSGLPNEIAILDAISQSCPHPNILSHLNSWSDDRNHYLVTELHGVNPHPIPFTDTEDDDACRPLDFVNPRRGRTEHIPVSVGSSDLWSWSLIQSQRPTTTGADFHLPHVAYALNPPPLASCRLIFAQLASALRHLHAAGVAHGDIKEENVLISTLNGGADAPEVKLADFGHADAPTIAHPDALARIRKYGTQEMTPPELLVNLASRNGARGYVETADPFPADVFAAGLVLYSLLHGPGCLPAAVHETVREGKPLKVASGGMYPLGQLRGDLDKEGLDLLRKMTAVDAKKRATMEEVVAHPWVKGILA
ncbi:hypothetical protein HK101_007359 [Irineochytrium annulatum]|nr:hypothetical protein HK101_007359 [Irineochytrium annulatum]